jgi:predicted glycosyltransferase
MYTLIFKRRRKLLRRKLLLEEYIAKMTEGKVFSRSIDDSITMARESMLLGTICVRTIVPLIAFHKMRDTFR